LQQHVKGDEPMALESGRENIIFGEKIDAFNESDLGY